MYKLIEQTNVPEEYQISISLEERYENEFTKIAATRDLPKEVDEAVKNMVKKKDHSYILVTAMGDGETYGSNKNGDYFPYDGLLGMQNTPVWGMDSEKDERAEINGKRLDPKLRYQTFEDSHFFHHHRNKIERDPHFGYVPKAIWNPKMHTVLLIIGVDRKKDPETAAMIDENKLIAVSMGAKLPWDRCSICGSTHKTIFQYCPHLKHSMGRILEDGRRVYAENLFPRFFDISKVTKPAFLAGMQLEKVAELNSNFEYSIDLANYYDIGQFDKCADVNKTSTIYKDIPTHIEGTIAKTCNTEQDLSHHLMNDLAQLKPSEAWGALTHAGIIAKPNEFAYILMKHNGRDDLADKFLRTHAIVSKKHPHGLDEQLHELADIKITHKAVKLANNIPDSILDERSIGTLNNRIYNTEKGLRKEAEIVRTIGLGSILSALYLLYRSNAESTFNAYGLLGSGIAQMIQDNKHTEKYIGNNAIITDAMNKQADLVGTAKPFLQSGKGKFLRATAGFATPYILSAHYQNKMESGQPVGIIGRTIANNPGKLGLIGAAGALAPKALWSGTKRVASDTISGVKKIFD